jgi:hypothetical protein
MESQSVTIYVMNTLSTLLKNASKHGVPKCNYKRDEYFVNFAEKHFQAWSPKV